MAIETLSAEQELFERLHCGNNKHLTRKDSTTGNYVLPSINDAWAGFQSARQFQAAELAAVQAKVGELHSCFSDLYAMVQGECPSLLEDYFMVPRYDKALANTDTPKEPSNGL